MSKIIYIYIYIYIKAQTEPFHINEIPKQIQFNLTKARIWIQKEEESDE